MGSTSPAALPALKTAPKIIFFTDYDGTITQQDSNDFLTDNLGYGLEKRLQGNHDVLYGQRHFRDSFQEMMDSVTTPFDRCIEVLSRNITLDTGFREFYDWTRANNVPIVILSGGMRPIIRGMLAGWLGEDEVDNVQIVSNDVAARPGKSINEEGGWRINFHDDSHFGHDKSLEIRPYGNLPAEERPILLYAGDGVSDLSAAKETDLLFAKAGRDLVTYCEKEKVPFTTFEDFSEILATVKAIAAGTLSVKDAATGRK
ncbi:HAD-like domain-containing protein [Phialemonium atrogriseum]|uniref:HAD-like domain-containing protein n=1 Tax=Phialemonium atrogriseum TaxID=1093897 RepID=A0AAJ0C1B6_9PEZI|nr:HAD-like domain-containing protein [Phialemonium atrogriseum]KAK1768091.1 HAD-like domain-containing protein [Phialemonium atrogriseum]